VLVSPDTGAGTKRAVRTWLDSVLQSDAAREVLGLTTGREAWVESALASDCCFELSSACPKGEARTRPDSVLASECSFELSSA
jgi:hypothetical protein